MTESPDFRLERSGSRWFLRPLTEVARSWLQARVGDGPQWTGGALPIESELVLDQAAYLRLQGFMVEVG